VTLPVPLLRADDGEEPDPASYYFRVTATFETSAPQHVWLTRVLTVAVARRRAAAVVYDAYTVT
jgi:uncharacterized protein DUF3237